MEDWILTDWTMTDEWAGNRTEIPVGIDAWIQTIDNIENYERVN